ncbi:fatty acid--CoA ligase [Bacillus testis]|uniref:fatty acid--CoA ligase n=1 Tax=Bacillus testis TaxID=1622072 RepID=UPI00067F2092|nr:fatty acid--CoA ligase [Bacillus testis]
MSMTIGRIFDLTVRKYPDQEALKDIRSKHSYTYLEWDGHITALANALKKEGVGKGDRVSVFLYNREEIASVYFACAKIGAVFNPINFRLMAEELAYILEDAAPKVLLFEQALEPVVSSIEQRFGHISFWNCDETAISYAASYWDHIRMKDLSPLADTVEETDDYAIMYTSGTTGRPKGVVHRHREMAEQSMLVIQAMDLKDKDRGLTIAPMFHCAELHCAFLPRVHVGALTVIMHQFNPKLVLEQIEKERITKLFAAPTMWNMLLQEDFKRYDLGSLDTGLYGAAPMAPVLVQACREHFHVKLVQAYGMTEMGPAITFLAEEDQLRKSGSAGKALINHEIRIVQPNEDGPSDPEAVVSPGATGEIIVQGPCVMKGYFNKQEATEKALYRDWYHTGDIGFLDDEGYLWVKDRVDDMIISGGENVYPREVEDVLYEHPGVLDVAVLGQPDDTWGERVVAFVVLKDHSLTEDDLETFCRQSDKLANYKRPRKYVFGDTLPRNASGKIQKFLLRTQLEQVIEDRHLSS